MCALTFVRSSPRPAPALSIGLNTEVRGDGEVDAESLVHDASHTISTSYSTDVTSGTWAYQDESFSKYHSEGMRDDEQLSEDSTHVNIAPLTGIKTNETGKLRTYTTDDQSTYGSFNIFQQGSATPTSGRSVGSGDWSSGNDGFGMKYIAAATGFHNQLDTATLDLQTSQTDGGTVTNTVDIDTRTRDEHKYDRTTVNLDFSMHFGGSSNGGIQYHQYRYSQTDHFNYSVYDHGIRTVHDYTEDFYHGFLTQMSMGMADADFDLDVFTFSAENEYRHTEGTIQGETLSGWRTGGTGSDLTFTLHDAAIGNYTFTLSTNNSYNLISYQLSHTPGRGYLNQRTSTNQNYQDYHMVWRSDRASSVSSTSFPNSVGSADTHSERIENLAGPNPDGLLEVDTHTWGSSTDSAGAPSSYDQQVDDAPGQLPSDTPLQLSDRTPTPPALGGYYQAWQDLAPLYYLPGNAGYALGGGWGAGMEAAGGGAGSSSGSGGGTVLSTTEGWVDVPSTDGETPTRVYYIRSETGTNSWDWRIDFYTAPPSEGGQYLRSEYGEAPTVLGGTGQGEATPDASPNPTPADEADNEMPLSASDYDVDQLIGDHIYKMWSDEFRSGHAEQANEIAEENAKNEIKKAEKKAPEIQVDAVLVDKASGEANAYIIQIEENTRSHSSPSRQLVVGYVRPAWLGPNPPKRIEDLLYEAKLADEEGNQRMAKLFMEQARREYNEYRGKHPLDHIYKAHEADIRQAQETVWGQLIIAREDLVRWRLEELINTPNGRRDYLAWVVAEYGPEIAQQVAQSPDLNLAPPWLKDQAREEIDGLLGLLIEGLTLGASEGIEVLPEAADAIRKSKFWRDESGTLDVDRIKELIGNGLTSKNARFLRRNMADAINAGEDAHHIVLSTHPRAEAARKLLGKYQIDINDAVNGVGLKPSGLKPAHHGHGLHSHDAIDRVTGRLRDAVDGVADRAEARQALLDALAKLKDEIAGGQFP